MTQDTCEVVMPSPHLGDQYEYTVTSENRIRLPAIGQLIGTWKGIDPNADVNNSLRLPDGGRIKIAIASDAKPHVSMSGGIVDAVQASYWLEVQGQPRALDVADEWITFATGNFLAGGNRNWFSEDGEVVFHDFRYARGNLPALLLSSLFWGDRMVDGSRGNLILPHEIPFSEASFLNKPPGELSWTVRTRHGEAGCIAMVEVNHVHPADLGMQETRELVTTIQLRFTATSALPTAYSSDATDAGAETERGFTFELVGVSQGSGPELAPFLEEPWPPASRMSHVELDAGFLADRDIGLGTSYDAAAEAMNSDATVASWRQSHPAAVPSTVTHWAARGPNGSEEWEILLSDGAAALQVTISQAVPVLGLVKPPLSVASAPESSVPALPRLSGAPTLRELDLLSQTLFQASLTNFTCNLSSSTCAFGQPEVEGNGLVLGIGAQVWLDKGWLLSETSSARTAIGEPVPMR